MFSKASKWYLIPILCLICHRQLAAQPPPQQEIDLHTFIGELFAIQDESVSYEDLYESLFQLFTSPLSLNDATFDELSGLYLLSPAQIENLLNHKKVNGDLLSLYELQSIPGFDMPTIQKIRPFVTLRQGKSKSPQPLIRRIATAPGNYLLLRTERTFEKAKGYYPADSHTESNRYLGDSFHHYLRFRASHPEDFSLGFTMEKDAGEQLAWKPTRRQQGFDYYSAHLQLKNVGPFRSVNIGDYQLQMGQGLVFGAGFSLGKGGETLLTVKRNSLGLLPYTSVLETGFFRGVATTWHAGNWQLTGMVSRLRQDASVKSDTLDGERHDYISSVLNTGFHRTKKELDSKDQIIEYNSGGTLLYKQNSFQAGLNTLFTHFTTPVQKPPALYNQFEFSGKSNFVGSIHLSKLWQNIQFFGEVARSSSGGLGAVAGIMLSVTNKLGISMVARSYDRHFHSFHARSFGENTRNINENGIYWGLRWKPASAWLFTAYYDRFYFPWLRYQVDAPSDGHEWMTMITRHFSKKTRLYGQYRQQLKAAASRLTAQQTSEPVQGSKANYLINLEHDTGHLLSFKSKVQWSHYSEAGLLSSGYALVQDVTLKSANWKLSARLALFDTENYSNRLYVYEKDVLYTFSIPAYSGRGMRTYLLLQYTLSRKITLWIRWARFFYPNQSTFGSGLQKIEGNSKNDLKVQARISF